MPTGLGKDPVGHGPHHVVIARLAHHGGVATAGGEEAMPVVRLLDQTWNPAIFYIFAQDIFMLYNIIISVYIFWSIYEPFRATLGACLTQTICYLILLWERAEKCQAITAQKCQRTSKARGRMH